ncbi:MAG: hypothetical protein IJH67_14750 [Thermoguttaceae bacterium]|nr:hypothetical protein [Thermoguttaceae bacterium]
MNASRRTFLKTVLAGTSLLAAPGMLGLIKAAELDSASTALLDDFLSPPQAAKPGAYWFFMDANLSKEGMAADLAAMKQAGLARAIPLEVALGAPKGKVDYMSPEWLDCWRFAAAEAEKQGIELTIPAGPGWCGAGGAWIAPENSMQHLRCSVTKVSGPGLVNVNLPVPEPRVPYFGMGSLGQFENQWREFYKDVAVIAYPTPRQEYRLADWEEKALFYRPPYSSVRGVKPYLTPDKTELPADAVIPFDKIIDVSRFMDANGVLQWTAPEGDWTILRLGRRLTGQTTRPAPSAGLGLECDKFEKSGFDQNYEKFLSQFLAVGKFTTLHHDSWEMSSQNWSENFRRHFIEKRGYDPLPWTPVMFGVPVESVEKSERFLWDLRRTAQELVYENNVEYMKRLGAKRGLNFSTEAYDLNPAGDLYLFRSADVPMGEFWSHNYGLNSEFSVIEAVSSGHTCGKKIIGAEAFTSSNDRWLQYPGAMKQQTDWALCAGINRFIFHRMFHQPTDDNRPGYSLSVHGVHWDRTQTWWSMAHAYHLYVARCQALLQRGLPSADVLYLDREGAPTVFTPPNSATSLISLPDRMEYNFDGCCPETLIERAAVKDGKIVFPDGMTYSVLVLPDSDAMTVALAQKLRQLHDAGAVIVGKRPKKSPSLAELGQDKRVAQLTDFLPESLPPQFEQDGFDLNQAIQKAKWVWSDRNYHRVEPGVEKTFVHEIDLSSNYSGQAVAAIAADNKCTLVVNGKIVGTCYNFKFAEKLFVGSAFRPGKNRIEARVFNGGEEPTPAGFLAAIEILDGDKKTVVSDSSWSCESQPAVALGGYNMSPWGLSLDGDSKTYPAFSSTKALLQRNGIAPDFESTGLVRWIHRLDGAAHIYFIANCLQEPQTASCTFRATGKSVQLWNPYSGKRYRVDEKQESNGRTMIPVPFAPSESWFVVFEPEPTPDESKLPPLSGLLKSETDKNVKTIELSRFSVAFNQNAATGRNMESGKEKTVVFQTPSDWSKSDDPYIRYYSGQAVYETNFDLDASVLNAKSAVLDLGAVCVMAQVELNGQDLGTLWLAPWTVDVPVALLRQKNNVLKITVANLWCNRLIGDAPLPEDQKSTWTSHRFYGPGDNQLQPSGLLEPVTLNVEM